MPEQQARVRSAAPLNSGPGPLLSPTDEPLDLEAIRNDFPAIHQEVAPGVPLVYLDNAATTLKPRVVIDAVDAYNTLYPANVHRGLHTLSERATEAFEAARERVARFLNAPDSATIVFTRGTTESINLVAQSWGRTFLKPDDEILLTPLEHHSNLVPWQMAAQQTGAKLVFTDMEADGRVTIEAFERAVSPRTRLVACTGMSNVLGTVLPIGQITELAHRRGAKVLVDAAQSVPHRPTDVAALGIDFLAFSGHKVYGPTGVGVLYAKRELLEAMPPVQGGGSMVLRVEEQTATWTEIPWKFEAGTPPIAEVIGLGAALEYVHALGQERIVDQEYRVTAHAHHVLKTLQGVRIIGPELCYKGGILCLEVQGMHPHDLAQFADRFGVAIRAGHHCAMPLHKRLALKASARASLAAYNTREDVEKLAEMLEAAHQYALGRVRVSKS